jgi:3-methylornithyl-N6-L-lysine dehydrogenase
VDVTRLTGDDVHELGAGLAGLDESLRRVTGLDLRGLALASADVSGGQSFVGRWVGVVPMTSGQGVIPGFSQAVAGIVSHLGCDAFVAPVSDVAGLAFVIERGAEVVFMADDQRFIALEVRAARVIDNGEATGIVYATALAHAARGVSGRTVLVVGLGAVGMAAAVRLARLGAVVLAYDPDLSRAEVAARSLPVLLVPSLADGLAACELILDASPAAEIIPASWVTGRSLVAAPGMPLGTTADAVAALGERLIHDPLALGVAAMAAEALFGDTPRPSGPGGGARSAHTFTRRPGERRTHVPRSSGVAGRLTVCATLRDVSTERR